VVSGDHARAGNRLARELEPFDLRVHHRSMRLFAPNPMKGRLASSSRGRAPAMKVIRIVPNLSSEAFVASRDFYVAMFDLVVSVELDDWYLQLMPESDTMLNIGFVKPDHDLFAGRTAPPGT
jgi:hypothetical protein